MQVNLIVAMDDDRCIGLNNQMPWRCQQDLINFREVTMGHAVIMGRKTFDSIKKPLEGRYNIVLSKHHFWELKNYYLSHYSMYDNIMVIDDILTAFKICISKKYDVCFVIGGSSIYKQALPYVSTVYLSRITKYSEWEGDTFFPIEIENDTGWKMIERNEIPAKEGWFEIYERLDGSVKNLTLDSDVLKMKE